MHCITLVFCPSLPSSPSPSNSTLRWCSHLSPLTCRRRCRTSLCFSRDYGPTRVSNCSSTTTTTNAATNVDKLESEVGEIRDKCSRWNWSAHSIYYFVHGESSEDRPALLLDHGFGASIPQWRSYNAVERRELCKGCKEGGKESAIPVTAYEEQAMNFFAGVLLLLICNTRGECLCRS